MRFDDVFRLQRDTCAGRHLQPFFGVIGTFLATFAGSFCLRSLLDYLYSNCKKAITGGETEPESDFEGGTYEFQVVKTAFLGTCQAAGSLIGSLQNEECLCGWLRPAMTAMVVFWLLCLPLGLIVFLSYRFIRKVKSKTIHFEPDKEATFAVYASKVWSATPSPDSEQFAYPPVVHVCIKYLLSIGIAVCLMMAIRASSAASLEGKVEQAAVEAGALWGITLLLYAAVLGLNSNVGRRITVIITNCFAVSGGKQYSVVEGGAVVSQDCQKSGCFFWIASMCTWLKVKVEAATHSETLDSLRCKGSWIKTDNLAMFYEAYNGLHGLNYCIFLLVKAVVIGIVLTNDQGVIVGALVKVIVFFTISLFVKLLCTDFSGLFDVVHFVQVWIIAGLYIADAAHQLFFSPDQDAINGLKIGLQQALQAVIMFIAALTTSGAISEEWGINVCINLSLVQVSLAIPEQLWGTVSNVTKKKGNPDEYEFKMTQKQINAEKVQVPSMTQRISIAKQLYSEFCELKQLVIEKETKSVLKKLLSQPKTITNMDLLFPYFIPSFFNRHLFSPEVKFFLYPQVKSLHMNNMTDAAGILDEVLLNEWEDCLDLRIGMNALMRLKTT